MKSIKTKRLCALLLVLAMALCVFPTTVFAAESVETELGHYVTQSETPIYPEDNTPPDGSGDGWTYEAEVFDLSIDSAVPGEVFAPKIRATYTDADGITYTLDRVYIEAIYDLDKWKSEVKYFVVGEEPVSWELPGNTQAVIVNAYWRTGATEEKPDEGSPAIVTNVINSLTRTVKANGTPINPGTQVGMDIYRVKTEEDKSSLTLTYDADMDMNMLGSSFFGDGSWKALQENKEKIQDITWVDLHFEFDSDIDVNQLDLKNAKLDSDMFVEKVDEKGEWWTIDSDNNELILHCRWDSESAMAAEKLDPMIKLTGVQVKLPSDWKGEDTIVINNHGYVDGMVYAYLAEDSSNLEHAAINGGEKYDSFVLTTSDKVSLPGLDKTVETEKGYGDATTAAANDTVNFKLESNVPENLKDYIEYIQSDTDYDGIAESGKAAEYTLTFHDQMDDELVLEPDSFTVTLIRKDGEREVLPNDPANGFYGLTLAPEDECDFEVSIALGALYNAGIITDDDLGTTRIEVTYSATLAEDVTAGTFENEAWVTNNHDWETPHDIVTVDTYGIQVTKLRTNTDEKLAGAEFTLYNSEHEEVATMETEGDGLATFGGLDAGTYYLKETKAPDGYVCSKDEIKIVIPEDAGSDNFFRMEVYNSQIPLTGGVGTTLFTIGGAAIIVGAGIVFVVTRRRKKVND